MSISDTAAYQLGRSIGLDLSRERIKELEQQVAELKSLCNERREFIINGEELGYIRKPDSENDSAYYIFLRCKMTDEAALESIKG